MRDIIKWMSEDDLLEAVETDWLATPKTRPDTYPWRPMDNREKRAAWAAKYYEEKLMDKLDEIKQWLKALKQGEYLKGTIAFGDTAWQGVLYCDDLLGMVERTCTWTKVDLSNCGYEPDAWSTSCGEDFAVIEEWHDEPTKFCQNCGGKVVEKETSNDQL